MSVWVLLMVLLNSVPGLEKETFLNKFDTFEECQSERNRIGFEMAEAYPYEADFRIICREHFPKAKLINHTNEEITTEYDEIVKSFGGKRYPGQTLNIRVLMVKSLENESGKLPAVAVQVHIFHKDGGESYIIFIKDQKILGWIDAGEAEEEDIEEEETFPGKEFA